MPLIILFFPLFSFLVSFFFSCFCRFPPFYLSVSSDSFLLLLLVFFFFNVSFSVFSISSSLLSFFPSSPFSVSSSLLSFFPSKASILFSACSFFFSDFASSFSSFYLHPLFSFFFLVSPPVCPLSVAVTLCFCLCLSDLLCSSPSQYLAVSVFVFVFVSISGSVAVGVLAIGVLRCSDVAVRPPLSVAILPSFGVVAVSVSPVRPFSGLPSLSGCLYSLRPDDVRLLMWPLVSGHSGSLAPVRPLQLLSGHFRVVLSFWPSSHCSVVWPIVSVSSPFRPSALRPFSSLFGVVLPFRLLSNRFSSRFGCLFGC